MRTTQSAVARLEREGSNPRVATLVLALRACGHELHIEVIERTRVATTEIAERVAMTPEERLASFEASHGEAARLVASARPVEPD